MFVALLVNILLQQTRANKRIPLTTDVRKRFLNHFHRAALQKKCHRSRVPIDVIHEFRDSVANEKDGNRFLAALGFRDQKKVLLSVFDKAIDISTKLNTEQFYYQDFCFDYTVHEAKLPFLRNYFVRTVLIIFLFYTLTAIIFCSLQIKGVCPDSNSASTQYHGIVSALYFASTTMSTVGYGDTSVFRGRGQVDPENWEILLGTIYMIVAVCVGAFVVSAGLQSAFTPFLKTSEKIVNYLANDQQNELLYVRINRVRLVKLLEICLTFITLNLIGVLMGRILFMLDGTQKWSWPMGFYWAVQTTSTIGYGNFNIVDGTGDDWKRVFLIFYLVISTFVVGDAFGKLADLDSDIQHIRRIWAFQKRMVSKDMIEEFQAFEHDGKIDQYEFAVASLLALNKISTEDLRPIMAKFQQLAGDDNIIDQNDIENEDIITSQNSHNLPLASLTANFGHAIPA